MENEIKIALSTGEIYVLAGLLGYSAVSGIENETLHEWQDDIFCRIKKVVARLEKKKLILVEPGGVLQIDNAVADAVSHISDADKICVVSGTVKSGRNSTVYIFCKSGTYTTVSRLDRDTYLITSSIHSPQERVIGEVLANMEASDIHIKVLMEEIEAAYRRIHSFSEEEARTELAKHVSGGSAVKLIKMLKGGLPFVNARLYERARDYYKPTLDSFILICDGKPVEISVDEYDVVSFDSISGRCFADKIRISFEERGTEK